MANLSEPSGSKNMAAKSSKSRPLLVTKGKAARKTDVQIPSESDSSDSRATSRSATLSSRNDPEESDSDARPVRQSMIRHPRQPNLAVKGARKLADNEDGLGSDDDRTVREEPSPRHPPRGLSPVRLEFPLPIERAGQVKRAVRRGGLQVAAANLNNKPAKNTRHHIVQRRQDASWPGLNHGRKEFKGGQRGYSRMSIGTASRRKTSRRPDAGTDEDAGCYIYDGAVAGDDSESEQNEDLYEPHEQAKAARKWQVGKKSVHKQPSSPRQPSPDVGAISEHVSSPPSAPSESEDEDLQPTKLSEPLLDVLDNISSTTTRILRVKQVPFLCRNLKKGFLLCCQSAGVDIKHHPTSQSAISVVYSYQPAASTPANIRNNPTMTARSLMKDWKCPFCSLHGNFPNPVVLSKHLSWDHPSVEVLWSQDHTTLSLNIHDPEPEFPVWSIPQPPQKQPSRMESTSTITHLDNIQGADIDQKAPYTFSSTTIESTRSQSSSASLSSQNELKPTDGKYSNEADAGSVKGSISVSEDVFSQAQSRGNSQAGLAPMATFPYLPETTGSGIVHYSCRPGGPRLFDIMNMQSLQPFGILKWVIVDREEELFELDDILDEDKVMQALWFRWIFLNRNKFVTNYFDGTKAFITENWQIIKQGAGLLALRAWLLVLAVNNFLLVAEVATLMRYYQELAGIMLQ